MMKKLFFIAVMLMTCIGFSAQAQQLTPLPLNPNVRTGVLPNGLTYFVLHNEEPKGKANFYIAQKVGSSLETPEQLGLAHFLEHMAFNGTKHYPGKAMLEYLQSKGIRFGQDINAYTSFDETVYNIDNIPTNDVALMDSVLLVLSDWSGSLLLEDSEIDAERGVIHGEWRQRNDANTRMFTKILPQIYQEYQYQQMPIGKMDIVLNFKPQVLRDYYHKWYRPDQQGIVVVGDFDADVMEKKVKELFSKIPMPENAAPRVYPTVSDNEKPIFAAYEDPEIQQTRLTISFKFDKTPVELRNTVEAYVQDYMAKNMLVSIINSRIEEYGQKPECNYAGAAVYFDDYYVSKTKGAFNVVVVAKDNILPAFQDAMSIVARACKTGVTDSEIERARDEMLASYERTYNERNKLNTSSLSREIIDYFVDNEPMPGIEREYELARQVMPMINAQFLNAIASQILTSNNQVLVYSQPQKEGNVMLSEEVATSKLNDILNAKYEAYVDEVITEPLIAQFPKPGKIKSTKKNKEFGTTEFTLSNGARVVIKPTDFAADEITLDAFRNGGKQSYTTNLANDVALLDITFDLTKWGPFDAVKLRKYLAGKKVSLSYAMNNFTNSFTGSTTVKDLPTMMELLYTAFTGLNPDPDVYQAQMSQYIAVLSNQDKDPRVQFSKAITAARYNNNPFMLPLSAQTIQGADYNTQLKLIKESLANAADYTFIFTGNINDVEAFKLLMNQYIGSLPSKGKAGKVKVVTPVEYPTGNIAKNFDIKSETPAVNVFKQYSGTNIPYNLKNAQMMEWVGEVLQIIYTGSLREELGGTYGAGTAGFLNPNMKEWTLLYQYQTNADQKDAMFARATSDLEGLLKNGTTAEYFNKVKGASLNQLDIALRTNAYWSSALFKYYRGFNDITNAREIISGITLEEFNAFMKQLSGLPNSVEVVMNQITE